MYLPEEERWYNFYDYSEIKQKGLIKSYTISNNKIGLFIKGGGIIPIKKRLRRSSKLLRFEPITIMIALNNENTAQGLVYFDDEESNDYDESNKIYMKKVHFQKDELFLAYIHDDFKISNKIERIIIMGIKRKINKIIFTIISDINKEENIEFNQEEDTTYLNRLRISLDYLWKIKFFYEE